MKTKILTFLGFLFFSINYGQVTQEWIATYDSEVSLMDAATKSYIDVSGNVYVIGARATGYINPENPDEGETFECVLIKYDSSGVEQWVQSYQSGVNLISQGLAITSDTSGNIVIAGLYSSEYVTSEEFGNYNLYNGFIAKYDNSGNELWTQNYDGSQSTTDWFDNVVIDAQDNIYVSGVANRNDPSNTTQDALIVKYSPTGTQLWFHEYDHFSESIDDSDTATAITLDSNANLYVSISSLVFIDLAAGLYESKIVVLKYNADGILQFTSLSSGITSGAGNDIKLDSIGNIIVTGTRIVTDEAQFDISKCLTIKFSPTGSLIWEKVHFVRDQSFGKFIGIDANDNIYITANYYRSVPNPTYPEESIGLTNVLLLKYNPSGDEVSSQTFISVQASSYDDAMSSKTDLQGNTYIAIASTAVWSFEIAPDFNYSIVKYNANAVQQWIQTYGNVGYETDDFPADLQIDSNNNVYVVGQNDAIGASMDITTIKYSQENLASQTFNQENLSVYPNPVNNILNINYYNEISKISIFNLLGQEVLTKNINSNQSQVDVSSLSLGSYLVKVVTDNEVKTIKIIKE